MNNRLVVWALAFSVGLNLMLLGMTFSHISQGPWPGALPAAATPRSSPAAFTLQFDEKRLQLTPAQHERFQEINERWMEEEKKAKTRGVDRIQRLSKVLVQDNASTATLQPELAEIRDHSDDFFERLTRALEDYRAELTPQQRVVFNRMLAERFNALQRFTRQRFFEYEQRMIQAKQGGKKKGDKRTGKTDKKGEGKGKKTGEKAVKSGEKPAEKKAQPAAPKPTPTPTATPAE